MRLPRLDPIRRALPIAVTLALAAMAAVALAQVDRTPPARAAVSAGSGAFEITNSREGAPIFAATGIAPGGSTSGTVTIKDVGSEAIALELHRGELVDTPGTGGGILSGRLQLTVLDITRPTPRTIYSGPLDAMPDRPAGELAAGEARTYQFTATLPDGGAASFQNAVQGAATEVAYSWIAGEASGEGEEEESGGGGEGGGGTGGGTSQPGGEAGTGSGSTGSSGGGAPSGGNPPAGGPPIVGRVLDLKVPKVKQAIRGGRLIAWTTCDMPCRLSVRGRIRATTAGAHRAARIRYAGSGLLSPGVQRLRIPIPPSLRRWILTAPGKVRLRAKLRVVAVATSGERDVVRKTLKLRAPRRH